MNAAPKSLRAHWYETGTKLMELDCALLGLIPDQSVGLANLPDYVRPLALTKLDSFVSECCRAQRQGALPTALHEQLAKDIWNFLKPWKAADLGRMS